MILIFALTLIIQTSKTFPKGIALRSNSDKNIINIIVIEISLYSVICNLIIYKTYNL